LIDASVTGAFSFLTGSMSTANNVPALSAGSGYASPAARQMPITDFSLPV
jgi:hypothetical protein